MWVKELGELEHLEGRSDISSGKNFKKCEGGGRRCHYVMFRRLGGERVQSKNALVWVNGR